MSADLDLVKRAVVLAHAVMLAAGNVAADGHVCVFAAFSGGAGVVCLVHL